MKKIALTLVTCVALLSTACASRGGMSTPSAGLCGGVDLIQALCAVPGAKPKAVAQVCEGSGVAALLCGPTAGATPAVCPPVIPAGCITGVLSSQKGRLLSGNEKNLLAECASYLAQVQQCAIISEPAPAVETP